MSPALSSAALAGGGRRRVRGRRGARRKGPQRLRLDPPPGHHAEVATPMGSALQQRGGRGAPCPGRARAERVAIIDFDVHHGNGTQDIFWNDPRVLYASTHQMPHYPGTGAVASAASTSRSSTRRLRAGDAETCSARLWRSRFCRASRHSILTLSHLGGLRRPSARSARQPKLRRRGLRLGDAQAHGDRAKDDARVASCPC